MIIVGNVGEDVVGKLADHVFLFMPLLGSKQINDGKSHTTEKSTLHLYITLKG